MKDIKQPEALRLLPYACTYSSYHSTQDNELQISNTDNTRCCKKISNTVAFISIMQQICINNHLFCCCHVIITTTIHRNTHMYIYQYAEPIQDDSCCSKQYVSKNNSSISGHT